MPCPSIDFKTQKPYLKSIENTEDLLNILRRNSLNIKHGLRSAVRHVLTLKSLNIFSPTIYPTRESVSHILNNRNTEIFELPTVRLPQPRNNMPEPNRLIL